MNVAWTKINVLLAAGRIMSTILMGGKMWHLYFAVCCDCHKQTPHIK